jgi:hypothetical protein
MKIFYILLNICFPYYNVVIPIYTKTNDSISTFCYTVSISSPNNSVCGSISKCYILDIAYFGVGIASTFSYS